MWSFTLGAVELDGLVQEGGGKIECLEGQQNRISCKLLLLLLEVFMGPCRLYVTASNVPKVR